MEAQALAQTGDNKVESVSSQHRHGSPFSETSSWTGLVDLDTAGVRSVAGSSNSSEISEEHVVIHLKPAEDWHQNQNGLETVGHIEEKEEEEEVEQTVITKAPNISSPESHGGSAQEEEDHYPEGSETPLPTTAPQTPQTQTSNSVLADIVESLMRPFRYWTGDEETQKEASHLGAAAGGEGRAQIEASTRNPSLSKAAGNKGDADNAIKEQSGRTRSIGPLAAGAPSPHEGLLEQEKEATPPNPQAPTVHKTAQSDITMPPGASKPPPAVKGMIFCV